jgi:inner membrane protein
MFNSTHTLVGLAIARIVPEKWARYGTATALIASNLPDIDSIAGFWGTAAYLDHHRGITHSLFGIPILSALLAGVMYFFSGNFGRTYAIALLAMATHPVLDYLNPYGLRPFLPFNRTWFYGDLVSIIDPYLDTILLLGILGSAVRKVRRVAVYASLLFALTYIGVRIQLHSNAVARLTFPGVEKSAALPQMSTPFEWAGMVLLRDEAIRFRIDLKAPPASLPPESGRDVTRIEREPWSTVVMKAATAPSAAAALRFARFPLSRVDEIPEGYRVSFMDFRFYSGPRTSGGAQVFLDHALNVVDDKLYSTEPMPMD